jgi:enamine deaminase RidA (YjgF/YER057c/UK114 family)
MTITRIETSKRISQAVVHNGIVYLAGQAAMDREGGSVTEQTENILERIDALLAQAGTDKSKLLTAQIWITDMRDFAEMNAVWDAWVSPGNSPARACVESRLARTYWAVEIACTAAVD